MRVSATVQLCRKSPYYLCEYHSALNIQIFNLTKRYAHNCFFCSTIPAVKKKIMAGFVTCKTKRSDSKAKQLSGKKECSPKKAMVKKDAKSKVAAKNDGRLMAKILITTIQVNLVPNPSETWQRQCSHSHFLATTFDFTSFFTLAFLGAALFFTA